MGDWPTLSDGAKYEAGVDTTISAGFRLPYVGTVNVKGAWVQLIASTSFHVQSMLIVLTSNVASKLFDIAIGAVGAEQVIVSNLLLGTLQYGNMTRAFWIPISVPAGSRISARHQGSLGFVYSWVSVHILAGGFMGSAPFGRVTTYGANTAASRGTQIDPGGTANTKGAWVEVTAASTNPTKAMLLGFSEGVSNLLPPVKWLVDVGIGSAGAEIVVIPNLALYADANVRNAMPNLGWLPCQIPSGTRITVRAQCDLTSANKFDIAVYGVD